jgi:hypothetical protein
MTDADRKAMEWIKQNTPEDALFAINTHFWLPNSPHGSDGGYWIPYFAEREITTDTMIASLGPGYDVVLERSKAVKELYDEDPTVNDLCALGIDYIYDGAKDPFDGKNINIETLSKMPNIKLIYGVEGVNILRICD